MQVQVIYSSMAANYQESDIEAIPTKKENDLLPNFSEILILTQTN